MNDHDYDRLLDALERAPEDDEPETSEERRAVDEGRKDVAEGRVLNAETLQDLMADPLFREAIEAYNSALEERDRANAELLDADMTCVDAHRPLNVLKAALRVQLAAITIAHALVAEARKSKLN